MRRRRRRPARRRGRGGLRRRPPNDAPTTMTRRAIGGRRAGGGGMSRASRRLPASRAPEQTRSIRPPRPGRSAHIDDPHRSNTRGPPPPDGTSTSSSPSCVDAEQREGVRRHAGLQPPACWAPPLLLRAGTAEARGHPRRTRTRRATAKASITIPPSTTRPRRGPGRRNDPGTGPVDGPPRVEAWPRPGPSPMARR